MKYLLFAFFLAAFVCTTAVSAQVNATPDGAVRALYTAHNAKRSPFYQTKSRARVNQYFTRELADLIWKDAVDSRGEVGALGADPLYNAQDTRITRFRIGKPSYGDGNLNVADVEVTFRNFGKAQTILFRLERNRARQWKVANVHYTSSGHGSLKEMLSAPVGDPDPNEAEIEGQLHKGTTNSYILYVGRETGDYAAYCFDNDSDAGKAILAKCKNGDQCRVKGETADDATCEAPGLEADLSARGRIVKVQSVRSLGKQR